MENVLRWEREWVARQFYLKVNDILIINFFFLGGSKGNFI